MACARKTALRSRFPLGFSEVATARKVLVTQQWGYISDTGGSGMVKYLL